MIKWKEDEIRMTSGDPTPDGKMKENELTFSPTKLFCQNFLPQYLQKRCKRNQKR